ncbi:hypothetical protein L6452_22103 [Arctium lappa]|uniref:Uncharacterized protein n=1 Tax=Arctium lappa TaxID=4217 RepID=A0ACB9AZR3_ARCLA|nr:hypothetical protein L6452_22103 [Arctium lappa]
MSWCLTYHLKAYEGPSFQKPQESEEKGEENASKMKENARKERDEDAYKGMVNTRGRPSGGGDCRDVSSRLLNPVVRVQAVVPPGIPPIFTGEVELVPRVDLASTSPVIQVVNPQADMMASVKETCRVLVGSGGTGNRVRTEENRVVSAPRIGKSCSYKSYLGCGPPEFSGSEDPTCVKWIRAIKQAFGSSECGDDQRVRISTQLLRDTTLTWWNVIQSTLSPTILAQLTWGEFKVKLLEQYCNERAMDRIEADFRALEKGNLTVREYTRQFMEKLGLVRHVASTKKEKIKAYLKGLPSDMMTMVRNSKASNLQETIEEAQFMEEVYARGKSEKAVAVVEKKKWESSSVPPKTTRSFVGNRSFNSYQEARWCQKCKTNHHSNYNTTPQSCYKCGKFDNITHDCPIRGLVCYECKTLGYMK